MKKRLYILIITIYAFIVIKAQQDIAWTHYWMLEPQYNAAAIGKNDALRIIGAYSSQMSGYTDAPNTMYLGVDLPLYFLNSHHALGASFLNDKLGLFEHKRVTFQYAYRCAMAGGRLSIGGQVDMLNETLDGSKIDVDEDGDKALPSGRIDGSRFDASFGLYFNRPDFYVGISANHLTAPKIILGETNEISIKRAYYFTGGYNIKLRNPLFTIHPSVFGVYDGTEYKAIVSARMDYSNDNKKLFGGANYSPQHSVAVFVGGIFHGVMLTYSYEAYTSGIGLGNGAHEVVLSYEMKLDLYKKGKNRHQSVRWL